MTYHRYHYRMLLFLVIAITSVLRPCAAPMLPQSDLDWKNVSIDGKKTTVFTIFTDSRGIAWIGTNSGLFFYDGITAHPVDREYMRGVQIYSIQEKEGTLFLGSNNGLLSYSSDSGIIENVTPASPKEIRTLLLIENIIWIGSLEGIYTYNITSGEIANRSEGLPHRSTYSLLYDDRGILYAGTYKGLARLNTSKSNFSRVNLKEGEARHGIFVNCMLESPDNTSIYIGTEGALYLYTPLTEDWKRIKGLDGNNVKSLSANRNGYILIGTDNGFFEMRGDTLRHFRHDSRNDQTISDNEIWHISSDENDNIWIGHEKGFSIASNSSAFRSIKLASLANSGEGNEIHAIFRDSKSRIWFGGTNGVILLPASGRPEWFRHSDSARALSHNRIRDIMEDSQSNIWFATDGGINRFNPAGRDFDVFHIVDSLGEHDTNWVYAVREYGDSIWVGGYLSGVHLISKDRLAGRGGTVVAQYSLNSDRSNLRGGRARLDNELVNTIINDSSDNLWILLYRDSLLTRISAKGDIERYNVKQISGQYPTNLAIDSQDRIWCAFNGGVVVFLPDRTHKLITLPDTDKDNGIYAINKVGEDMWLSTLGNVWKIDGSTYGVKLLPLPQKSYTAIYDDTLSGKVYLGTTDEIVEVSPKALEATDRSHDVTLLRESSCDIPLRHSGEYNLEEITIPYEGSLTLVVSNLDYSPEAVQRYMYKLAKSATDTVGGWIVLPEGVNTISLSDISMGRYTLIVKNVGDLSTPLHIPLKVKGHWLLSSWAFAMYLIILSAVIYFTVWYMRRRNMLKLQEEERRKSIESVEKKLRFLSNISHDFKTPLSMILGPASLMKEQSKNPEEKRNLEAIYQNAVRLNNLIHRTLELNHLDDDTDNLLILSSFDIVGFCKDLFDAFKENNSNKKFVFHSSVRRLLIEADAVKFESVITNLLSNSCKYSEEGATISLGIHADGNRVEIVVSDDGLGISEDDQPFVFQRMFRAHSTATVREGTGLGLYLIKKYLDLMHGSIELYSREGQGTSFVVSMPVSENMAATEENENCEDDDMNKPKILIVDDNLQISNFIRSILKKDFTCFVAENGKAGLSLASSITPDLIIVDEMMPVMKGTEMAARIKQNPRLSAIPIIMLTAKDDNITENESIKAGVDSFLSKPFEPSVLISRINHLLKSRSDMKQSLRIEKLTDTRPIEAESVIEKQLAHIAQIIEENVSDPDLNVNLLCEKSGIPNKQLYRIIKKHMGIGPLDYIKRVRLQKAAMLLSQHRFTVSEISYMVGFKTPSYFAKCFQQQFGVIPSQYHSEDESPLDTPPSQDK